eukprot:GHVN01068294.1.p1 GENE.GHVN01068294.1~~GHVN01068294.1.p1  ORF type:complete len:734 (+),score=62.79 GHVN01068294.1:115-2316(+)
MGGEISPSAPDWPVSAMPRTAVESDEPSCEFSVPCDNTVGEVEVNMPDGPRAKLEYYGFERDAAPTTHDIEVLIEYIPPSTGMRLVGGKVKGMPAVSKLPRLPYILRKIYELIQGKKDAGKSILISTDEEIRERLPILFPYLQEYSREPIHNDNELGVEYQYGYMALELLCGEPSNVAYLVDPNLDHFGGISPADQIVDSLRIVEDEDMVQYAVRAGAIFAKHPHGGKALSDAPTSVPVICQILDRGREADLDDDESEELLIPRLQLIERTAVNRTVYANTGIILPLLDLWEDYDENIYSEALLRHDFRVIRRVICDQFVEPVLKVQAIPRLIALLNDKSKSNMLLGDVAFVVGSLGVVPEVKTMIGEARGIEALINLLTRSYKDPPPNSVPTNTCLALGNLVMQHEGNNKKFEKLKGPQLNITVMQVKAAENDHEVVNGCSVLLCNACYQNDNMKGCYGTKKAPKCIVDAMSLYSGSDSKMEIRCLESLLKAAANLSLYEANVREFLAAGIHDSYGHLLGVSSNLPNGTVDTLLRTLSNLVMEFDPAYMDKFSNLVVPLVELIKQGGRDDVTMITLTFEVLSNLCRLEKNAIAFSNASGIEAVMQLLKNADDDYMITNGLRCLMRCSTMPDSTAIMCEEGLFELMVQMFDLQVSIDGEDSSVELCVACLRCCRHSITDESEACDFVESGGINSILALASVYSDASLLVMETWRVVLTVMDNFEPPWSSGGSR